MQPSKGQGGSDRGYGPEYGVAMPCLRLFRGWQDKDRHDETIRHAESAFRFPSPGPRSAGGRGDDHRDDRRSQVVILREDHSCPRTGATQTAAPEASEMSIPMGLPRAGSSAPALVESAVGRNPTLATSAVISTGRRRSTVLRGSDRTEFRRGEPHASPGLM